MKLFKLILCISIFMPTLHAAPPSWTAKPDFPGTARLGAVAFSIGNIGYVGTGYDPVNNNRSDFWAYNTMTETWAQMKDFSGSASNGTSGVFIRNNISFVIGSLAYVGMGENTTHVVEYNSITNVWTPKAAITGTSESVGVGFAIGTKGYFRSGKVEAMRNKTAFWEYDQVGNTWAQKVDMGPLNPIGHVRRSAAGFAIGNRGYIGTGLDSNNVVRRDFWEYNPGANSWTQKNDFGGTARFSTTSFASSTKGYIGLGYDTGVPGEKHFWEYNPTNDSWTQILDFPGNRRSQGVGFAVDDKLYVGLGNYGDNPPNGDGYFKDFYRFSPTGEPALPVELTTFKAVADVEKAQVAIKWATASEINNDYFSIERRGKPTGPFQEIGRVKGASNSSKALSYDFLDEQPLSGIAYYRLRHFDADGSVAYSKTVSVSYKKGVKITVFPTTTEGSITIDSGNERIENVQIFNTSGQLMVNTNQNQVDLSPLPRGMYLVRVQSKGTFFVEKVFKK